MTNVTVTFPLPADNEGTESPYWLIIDPNWDKHKLREIDRKKIALLFTIMSNNCYRMSDCFWSRTADLFTHR